MYKLSIIAYVEENYVLDGLFNSLKNQMDVEVLSDIQVVIVDSCGNTQNIEYFKRAGEEYEFVIDYISCPGENVAQCYNRALGNAEGVYVSFVDCDSEYSVNCIRKLYDVIENCEISDKQYICIRPMFMRSEGDKVVYKVYPDGGGTRDISKSTKNVNLCLYSYFIKRDVALKLRFNEEFPTESRQLFILDLIETETVYYGLNKCDITYYHALEDVVSFFVPQHSKEWYTDTFIRCYLPYIREKYENGIMTWELETAFIYLIYSRYVCNLNEANKGVLSGDEITDFYNATYEILRYIRYDSIIQRKRVNKCFLPTWLVWKFISNKAKLCGDDCRLTFSGGSFVIDMENEECMEIPCKYKIFDFQQRKTDIYAINYNDNKITIDGALPPLPVEWVQYVGVSASGATVCPQKTYNITECFGETVARAYMFKAVTELKRNKELQTISFRAYVFERSYIIPLSFKRPGARLASSVMGSYWFFGGNRILRYDAFYKKLQITKCSENELNCVESNYCLAVKHDLLLTQEEKDEIINLRRQYWEYYHNKTGDRKPLWVTFDKLYKAGDNGEYMYHYVRDNCPEIDMYYIIDENSADYERLKSDTHVLVHKSERAKEIALKADVILATHVNTMVYCGFTNESERKYLRNLYNGEIVCIQHGLTVQDIAIWQNMLYDNTRLYCCASKYELQNVMQPVYGYEPEQVKLNGLARYDGLINNDKKQILIAPTWRRDIVNGGVACNKKTYNEYFKSSEYYRIYNSLINDRKLIECAESHGYKIVYLLHPAMSSQIDDYDRNDYVELIAATGNMSYEKILTESSLMITDYSGVQFDFAYMRKPILYYHPETLPPQYEESNAFRYETMGFGTIITNHEDLVEQVCSYIENECRMSEMYQDRADDFFAFDDNSSCKRIYRDVSEYMRAKKEVDNYNMKKTDKLDYAKPELELRDKENELKEIRGKLEACETRLKYMENSVVWKAGAPIRSIRKMYGKIKKRVH